jgi:hypothetical protein
VEAARTYQLHRSSVELREGAVAIDGLIVDDRTLVDLVARRVEAGTPAEDTVLDALEIGARVLDRESTQADVDLVKREFERVSAQVEQSFGERARLVGEGLQAQLERFLGDEDGSMSRALDTHTEQLGELMASNFGAERSTAVQHQLREVVGRLLQESRQDLLRQFSAQDGHNPLADFKGAVVRELRDTRGKQDVVAERLVALEGQIQRLRDADASQAELALERERGTGKGRTFEGQAFEIVERLAEGRGDVAHHVGDARSAAGGKLGDIVIEIEAASGEARGRIALELKDERLSKNRAWEILNGALAERDAGFAILVVAADEKVPAGREPLHEYEGNKMIVTLDKETLEPQALELAYRYARCRCLMAQERTLKVDAAGVRDASQEALSALREAQKVRSSLTGATNGVEAARKALDVMVARVQANLERVEHLIAAA